MKNHIKTSIAFLLFSTLVVLLSAQENLQFKPLTIIDGLSSNRIRSVKQDKHGYLWIVAGKVLNKYDGQTIEVYENIPGDSTSIGITTPWDLFLDQEENLWINGRDMISRYNYSDDSFTNFPMKTAYFFFQDSYGKYWLVKNDGTFQFDPETGVIEPIQLMIDSNLVKSTRYGGVAEMADGGLLAHQNRIGLFKYQRDSNVFHKVNWESDGFIEEEEFIFSIIDDSLGNIWLNGFNLYKYDVKKNMVKRYDLKADKRNWFRAITKDNKDNLWVHEVFNGKRTIFRINPYTNKYQEIDSQNGLDDLGLNELYIDKSGMYWIGGYSAGLFKADPSIEPIGSLKANADEENIVEIDSIRCIYQSPYNPDILWIGTYNYGLYKYNETENTIQKIHLEFKKPKELRYDNSTAVNGIFEDKTFLWFGIMEVGLCRWDKSKNKLKVYYNDPNDASAVLPSIINKIVADENGNLWLGGYGGLTYFNVKEERATNFYSPWSKRYDNETMDLFREFKKENPYSYGFSSVTDSVIFSTKFSIDKTQHFLVQSSGEVWLWRNNSFNDYGWIENSAGDTLWTLKDFPTTMSLGNKFRMKLDVLTLEPGEYSICYVSDNKNSSTNLGEEVGEDKDFYGIQLYTIPFDKYNDFKKLISEADNQAIISDYYTYDLLLDNDILWITTGNGINKLDLESGEISYFENEPVQSSSENTYFGILEMNDSTLWIGSFLKGLLLFNKNDGSTRYFDMQDGLPSNIIHALVEDDLGNIWLSTENGISKFINKDDPNPPRFINYDTRDGLYARSFLRNCAAKTGSGKLYFGSSSGINHFFPTNVNSSEPIIGITRLYIRNKEVSVRSPGSPLSKQILDTDELTLTYNQNSFGFDFNSFHYSRPNKNKLAHILEGFETEWVYDNKSNVSYTNIEPGIYTFRVKGSNGDGFWNEEGKSIRITILKPWYRTYLAYIGYFLVLGLVVFIIDRIQRHRIFKKTREKLRLKEAEHRAESAELQAKATEAQSKLIQAENERKTKELDQAKEIKKAYNQLKEAQSQLIHAEKMASLGELTAGIAHEIQNPLNFVNNFSELNAELITELKEEIEKGDKEEAMAIANDIAGNEEKINHHGKRADGIVKGMLQHSRSSTNEKEPTDINVLADEYLRLSYHGLRAKDKSFNADFKTDLDETIPRINIIPQDIGRVLLNLINNAFYAVSAEASAKVDGLYKPIVVISTKKLDNKVEIRVKDNGNGIPTGVKDKIFQPFFTTKPSGEGTGLGLSLSYDIITNGHGGELKVETKVGEGSIFTIQLPV